MSFSGKFRIYRREPVIVDITALNGTYLKSIESNEHRKREILRVKNKDYAFQLEKGLKSKQYSLTWISRAGDSKAADQLADLKDSAYTASLATYQYYDWLIRELIRAEGFEIRTLSE